MSIRTFSTVSLDSLFTLDSAGWVIFPLFPFATESDGSARCLCKLGSNCPNPGKHPREKWTRFVNRFNRIGIGAMWQRFPAAGWGVHLGPSDLVVLDIDPRNGGMESLAAWQERHGKLPATMIAESGSGGLHYYFQAPAADLPKTKTDLLPGLELLSGRHFVVIPPSPHKSGRAYRWLAGTDDAIAGLPEAVESEARKLVEQAGAEKQMARATSHSTSPGVSFSPPAHLSTSTVVDRARAYLACLPPAVSGQGGSKVTFRAACVLVQGFGLSMADAMPLLQEYNQSCVPPWSASELEHKLDDAARAAGERGYLLADSYPRESGKEWIDWVLDQELGSVSGAAWDNVTVVPSLASSPRAGNDGADLHAIRTVAAGDAPSRAFWLQLRKEDEDARSAIETNRQADAALRRRHRCTNLYCVYVAKASESLLLRRRCLKWSGCPGCRRYLEERHLANLTNRLQAAAEAGRTLYMQTVDRARAGTARKQLWRAAANYVCIWNDETGQQFWILSDAPVSHSTPISPQDALDQFRTRLVDPLRTGKHIHYSARWRLPKIKPKEAKGYERIGVFACPNNFYEHIREIAQINGMKLGRGSTRPPTPGGTGSCDTIVDTWKLSHPRPMGREEILNVFGQLRGTEYPVDFRDDSDDDLLFAVQTGVRDTDTGLANRHLAFDLAFTP